MFARAILHDIPKYYEFEENVRAFEKRQHEQKQRLVSKTNTQKKI